MEFKSARQIVELVKSKKVKARKVVDYYLKKVAERNPELNVFLEIEKEKIIAQAEAVDEKVSAGKTEGKLLGVPVAIKDNINVKGSKLTCASRILEGYVSPYDATVIEKIKAEGGIIFGRTNMDEFAMGSSNEFSAYGPARNPHDVERVAGGSSGGSAAAVGGGLVPLALGSDTGGSIREPASFCGVIGVKPTYGRVSRYGLVAFSSSLDQIGPFAQNVEDAALLLDVISGKDHRDSTSEESVSIGEISSRKPKKIGLIKELWHNEGMSEEVKKSLERVFSILTEDGVEIEEVSLPALKYAIAVYYLISSSEASSNLARFDGIRYGKRLSGENVKELISKTRDEGFGEEVKRRILLGTFALSAGYYDAYYKRALKLKTLIINDFEKAFSTYEYLLSPTVPEVAFRLGEKQDDILKMYLSDICTTSINLAGLPALSFPVKNVLGKMPVGLQVVAPRFSEKGLLETAKYIEGKGVK
jgi:aspartyl-tRNA(Asn)/glutamyl-tRNA(Gln) amidotransferase subunit A